MKDLTQINGVKVVERTPARYSNENDSPSSEAIGKTIETVDEVLLEDGTVVYQCNHPRGEDCEYTGGRIRVVTAHQAKHSAGRQLRATQRELAQLRSETEAAKLRKSNGGKKAAATRAATRMSEQMQLPLEAGHHSREPETELEISAQRVVLAYNAAVEAQNEFNRVFTGYLRAAATAAKPVVTPVDPTILKKAENWDKYIEFQSLIQQSGTTNPNTHTAASHGRRRRQG